MQPGTPEWDEWYALASKAMATYWPEVNIDELMITEHNSSCNYELGNYRQEQVETPAPEKEPKVIPDWCAFVPNDPECNPTL